METGPNAVVRAAAVESNLCPYPGQMSVFVQGGRHGQMETPLSAVVCRLMIRVRPDALHSLTTPLRKPMKCYACTWRVLAKLPFAVLLLGAASVCTTIPRLPVKIIGWVGIFFFGLCFLILLRRLVQTEPLVVIDENKIEDRRAGWRIPWEQVKDVSVGHTLSTRYLCVEVDDPSQYLQSSPGMAATLRRQMAWLGAALSGTPCTIHFQELDPGIDEVWEYIERNAPRRVHEH